MAGVKDGVWQTAVFDVTAFTDLLVSSDEVTVTLYVNTEEEDGCGVDHLGIAAIRTVAGAYSDGTSPGLVIGIVAALVFLMVVVFLCLSQKSKKRKS